MTKWPNILKALRACDGWDTFDASPANDAKDEAWLLAHSTEEERVAAEAAVVSLLNMPGSLQPDDIDSAFFRFCNPEDGEAEEMAGKDRRLLALGAILERIFT